MPTRSRTVFLAVAACVAIGACAVRRVPAPAGSASLPAAPTPAGSASTSAPRQTRLEPWPACTPLDPVAAAAAERLLVSRSSGTAVGPLLAGQCLPGEAVTAEVPVRAGCCYTLVAIGLPPVERVAIEFGDQPVARSETPGSDAGASPACIPWRGPDGTTRLTVRAGTGRGVVAARAYESRMP